MISRNKINLVVFASYCVILCFLVLGCEEKCPTCPTYKNYYIVRVSGDGAIGTTGSSVTLKVLVTDRAGFPIEGCRVDWEIIEGRGTLSEETTTTSVKYYIYDIGGEASVDLTLGEIPGEIKVKATVFANGESVVFTVTASET